MAEDRAAPRYRVRKPAFIKYGGDKISCTVCDLSLTGASLEVFDVKNAPAKFTLVIPEDGLEIPCQVIRRTEFRLGIKFD
jgi:hypothetical protein